MVYAKVLGPETHIRPTWFALAEPVQITFRGNAYVMVKGFPTDFASVPRFLWSIFPPHGLAARASVKHDWLYDEHKNFDSIGDDEATRLSVDQVFYRDMIADGVPRWQARIMFKAVRWFGKKYWND